MATPVLDVLQTMPAFVYLAPFALFFSIGPALAVASPWSTPCRRPCGSRRRHRDGLAHHAGGHRLARPDPVPAADPGAAADGPRTIIVGINQTIMAALSMVVIAGFVNRPGLGKPVLRALQAGQVGPAFTPGCASWSSRSCSTAPPPRPGPARADRPRRRGQHPRPPDRARCGGGRGRRDGLPLAAQLRFAEFPATSIGATVPTAVQDLSGWLTDHLDGVTTGLQRGTTSTSSTRCRTSWPGRRGSSRGRPCCSWPWSSPARGAADHRRLPGGDLAHRPLVRRDGHPHHGARRHRLRDAARGGGGGLDGAQPPRGPGGPTGPGRRPGDAVVRLPDPGAALFDPTRFTAIFAGDRLRRPGRHQAGRRRHRRVPATTVEAAPLAGRRRGR